MLIYCVLVPRVSSGGGSGSTSTSSTSSTSAVVDRSNCCNAAYPAYLVSLEPRPLLRLRTVTTAGREARHQLIPAGVGSGVAEGLAGHPRMGKSEQMAQQIDRGPRQQLSPGGSHQEAALGLVGRGGQMP